MTCAEKKTEEFCFLESTRIMRGGERGHPKRGGGVSPFLVKKEKHRNEKKMYFSGSIHSRMKIPKAPVSGGLGEVQ